MDIHQDPFHARLPNIREQLSVTREFLSEHRKVLLLLALGLFLFFWYEIRPIRINKACMAEASANARALLVSKAEVATEAAKKASYMQLVAKDMYLRSDYESFYSKCMRRHGKNV